MARPNKKKQEQQDKIKKQQELNRLKNEREIQHSIGKDYLNPYHGPHIPDETDNIINKFNNNAPDFDNFTYSKDESIYNESWSDVNKKTSTLSIDDFVEQPEILKELELSSDEVLNDYLLRKTEAGLSYEDMKTEMNRGRRDGTLTEEQWALGKEYLDKNKDYINSQSAQVKQTVKNGTEDTLEKVAKEGIEEGSEVLENTYLKKALSGRNINALVNLGFAVSDYNEARNAGDGVVKAGVKAGAQFVAGEALGMWMMPVMALKAAPSMVVSGAEALQNTTRKMNSTSRIQTFGEAQFHDTQQLATMRQAGMEMAKMSQYNLQQSIMGNEAQYMHRL